MVFSFADHKRRGRGQWRRPGRMRCIRRNQNVCDVNPDRVDGVRRASSVAQPTREPVSVIGLYFGVGGAPRRSICPTCGPSPSHHLIPDLLSCRRSHPVANRNTSKHCGDARPHRHPIWAAATGAAGRTPDLLGTGRSSGCNSPQRGGGHPTTTHLSASAIFCIKF